MERFVIIVNGWRQFSIITKHSILDVAAALYPPLMRKQKNWYASRKTTCEGIRIDVAAAQFGLQQKICKPTHIVLHWLTFHIITKIGDGIKFSLITSSKLPPPKRFCKIYFENLSSTSWWTRSAAFQKSKIFKSNNFWVRT